MVHQWFVKNGPWYDGPVGLDRLRELVAAGQLGPQALVRRVDETRWRTVAELEEVNLPLRASGFAGTTESVPVGVERAVPSPPGSATTPTAAWNDPIPPPVCVPPPRLAEVAGPEPAEQTAWPIFLWVPVVTALGVVAVVAIMIATQWSRESYREARAAEMASLVAEVESHVGQENIAAARESLRSLEQALGPEASTDPWPARTRQLARAIEKCQQHVAARDLWQRGVQASESDDPKSAIPLLTKCIDLGDEEFLDGATKLRAEIELAISTERATAEVAAWTDDQLAGVLAGGALPNPPPIASPQLLARYDGLLRTSADKERERLAAQQRLLAAQREARARADAERRRLEEFAEERERLQRAEEEALIAARVKREADDAAWRADKDAHGMLRLIPADALAAVATPNPLAFDKRVGAVKPFELANYLNYYLSYRFASGIGLEGTGLDPTQPAANIWAVSGKAAGEAVPAPLPDLETNRVFVYATNDLAKACKTFKLDERAIRAGEVSPPGPMLMWFATLRDKYLFLGADRDVVMHVAESYAKGESLATQMAAEEGRALMKRDVVAYVGPRVWREYRAHYREAYESILDAGVKDPKVREFWDACLAAPGQVRMGVVGVDLKKDLEIQAVAKFNHPIDAEVSNVLKLLNAGSEPPDLTHLPRDHALGVFAARGDGASNAAVARVLFHVLINRWNAIPHRRYRAEDIEEIADLWDEAWGNVRSVLAALYHTGFEAAYVALLDSDDPAAFIEAVRTLVDRNNAVTRRSEGLAEYSFALEELFGRRAYVVTSETPGTGWNRIRIVPCKGKIVLFLGSKLDLLQETLQNVEESRPGLADHEGLRDSLKSLDPKRNVQFSVSATGFQAAEGAAGPLLASPKEYSSASLTLSQEQVKLDLIVPIAELRPLMESPSWILPPFLR